MRISPFVLAALLPLFSSFKTPARPAPKEASPPCQEGKPYDVSCHRFPVGYNAPAAVNLQRSWSPYARASLVYWYANESGLFIAQSAILNGGSIVLPPESESLTQKFEFKPGLKVAMGAIYDNEWVFDANYTWFQSKTDMTRAAPENTSATPGLGIWNMGDWFQQTISVSDDVDVAQSQSLSGTSLTSDWDLNMNIVDLMASRPFYQGSRLIVKPEMGIRSAWISQDLDIALMQAGASVGGDANLGPQPIHSLNHSRNFGIGPRVGFGAECLVSKEWRIEGFCSGSMLATWFTKITHSEDAESILVTPGPYKIENKHQFVLLPNAEMKLGFGWSTYAKKGRYHFDVAATYDFMLFWEQNKIRQTLDHFWSGIGDTAANLALNGATLTFCVNF